MGPAPSASQQGPRVEVLDSSRQRLLQVLAQRPSSAPPTVAELAAVLGGHPNTTRHHLGVLVEAGLLCEEPGPPGGGRGRPASRYAVTPAGRAAVRDSVSTGAAAEEYVALAAAFAERLAERNDDPGADARAIGKAWGATLVTRHLADGPVAATGGQAVVDLLDRLGFSPDTEPAREAGTGTTVLLRTCPLLEAARRHPDVVCQVHLGLVAGALDAHGDASDGLSLVPFARAGACELGLPPTLGG